MRAAHCTDDRLCSFDPTYYEASCAAQGDQPHCGFPEAKYLDCVERLVRHGLRVVVVEQTETPEMLKQRNDNRTPGTKKVSQLLQSIMASLHCTEPLRTTQLFL